MRVAIAHDYLKEYGGAERVLRALTEIYPNAPIYTAFRVAGSTADREFKGSLIKESWLAPILKIWRLYSPLRFLAPIIWKSFDLSSYDLVVASSSWYITRGFKVGPRTKTICYCHTPPRWLYGYETSVGFTKYWPVKIYAAIVGHFMRMYDFASAQTPARHRLSPQATAGGVDFWIANSKNVAARIKKFYRRDSTVIYPPVDVEEIIEVNKNTKKASGPEGLRSGRENYFLVTSRLVGAKGLEEAAKAAKKLGFRLKIVGEAPGFADVESKLKRLSGGKIELLGWLNDISLYHLYAGAKALMALAKDEDFGITPVEAMAAGTPVIAFNGGGFRESVVDGKTGILIDSRDERAIGEAIEKLDKVKWRQETLRNQARKFSKERFITDFRRFIELIYADKMSKHGDKTTSRGYNL